MGPGERRPSKPEAPDVAATRNLDDEPAALIRPGSAHLPESADILAYDF